jgi:hypothetical protein
VAQATIRLISLEFEGTWVRIPYGVLLMGLIRIRQTTEGLLRIVKAEDVRVGSSQPEKQLKINANDDVYDYALAA